MPRLICCLQITFVDQLGIAASDAENELASRGEAKRVAFLLFWYVKPYLDRQVPDTILETL